MSSHYFHRRQPSYNKSRHKSDVTNPSDANPIDEGTSQNGNGCDDPECTNTSRAPPSPADAHPAGPHAVSSTPSGANSSSEVSPTASESNSPDVSPTPSEVNSPDPGISTLPDPSSASTTPVSPAPFISPPSSTFIPSNNPDQGPSSVTQNTQLPTSDNAASEPTVISNDINPDLSSDSQSLSTATPNPNTNIQTSAAPQSFTRKSSYVLSGTIAYGVDPSTGATQSLGGDSALNTTISTASQGSKSSHVGAIVGGILGSFAFVLLVILTLVFIRRRHRQKYRIAPSTEYLASQYPFNPSTQQFTDHDDGLISVRERDSRPNTPPPFHDDRANS